MGQPLEKKPALAEVIYPEREAPRLESELHGRMIRDVVSMLEERYRGRPDVHVGTDLCFYYREGDPTSFFAPDIYVTFGMDNRPRAIAKGWEDGIPAVIFEMTSKRTRRRDTVWKMDVYAQIGVNEYFLVDPEGTWIKPPLQGFRLAPKGYERIPGPELVSQGLGLRMFRPAPGRLDLYDLATNERLLRPDEWAERAMQAQREAQRAQEAEARIRALEAELARLRGGST